MKKLAFIDTKNGCFLSDNPSYGETELARYFIDGKKPVLSFNKKWVCVESKPKKIEVSVNQPDINHRYELIDKSLASDKFPEILNREDVAYYDQYEYSWIWKPEYKHKESLYELKSDPQPDILQEVPFEIEKTIHYDKIEEHNGFSYPAVGQGTFGNDNFDLTGEDVNYSLLETIVNADIALPMRPCFLTSKQSYEIIRRFIQDNIDPKIAKITSDYRFCFTVKKRIPIEPESYTIDENLFTKRKPRLKTRWRREREVEIFEMTHSEENYQGYTPIKGFEGQNIKNLKQNIDEYLDKLIKEINKPLEECSNCNGRGVLSK